MTDSPPLSYYSPPEPPPCPDCEGQGVNYMYENRSPGHGMWIRERCQRCDGTGEQPPPHTDLDSLDLEHDLGTRDLTDPWE